MKIEWDYRASRSNAELMEALYSYEVEALITVLEGSLFELEYVKKVYHEYSKSKNRTGEFDLTIISTGFKVSVLMGKKRNAYLVCHDITNSRVILIPNTHVEFTFSGAILKIENDRLVHDFSQLIASVREDLDKNNWEETSSKESFIKLDCKINLEIENNKRKIQNVFVKYKQHEDWSIYSGLTYFKKNGYTTRSYNLNGHFDEICELDTVKLTDCNYITNFRGEQALAIRNGPENFKIFEIRKSIFRSLRYIGRRFTKEQLPIPFAPEVLTSDGVFDFGTFSVSLFDIERGNVWTNEHIWKLTDFEVLRDFLNEIEIYDAHVNQFDN